MSERKVLNKYYPPDFDPSKIPRMKLAKNRQYTVRLMAPFNMRCKTCGEYIYKGKKFNARKEDVEHETYLGIRIYRFYIKCTRCLQEISFKTDPQNTDYEIEAGATRNFMALKLAEEQARREEEEKREEEASNPMKLLENRTKQSRNEIEMLESLEELHDLNQRQQTIDYDSMLKQYNKDDDADLIAMSQEQEDKYIKSLFKTKPNGLKKVIKEEIVEIKSEDGDLKSTLSTSTTTVLKPTFKVQNENIGLKRKLTTPLVKLKQRTIEMTSTTGTTTAEGTNTTATTSNTTTTAEAKTTPPANTPKSLSNLVAYSGSSDSE